MVQMATGLIMPTSTICGEVDEAELMKMVSHQRVLRIIFMSDLRSVVLIRRVTCRVAGDDYQCCRPAGRKV